MKEKQVYKKIWPLPVKNFKKLFYGIKLYISSPASRTNVKVLPIRTHTSVSDISLEFEL